MSQDFGDYCSNDLGHFILRSMFSFRSESAYGWCVFSFLLIYYFTFAGVLWYVMLSYAWHSSFRTLGSTKDKLVGKKTYFHVLSWMIPVVSTIAILILEEVGISLLNV